MLDSSVARSVEKSLWRYLKSRSLYFLLLLFGTFLFGIGFLSDILGIPDFVKDLIFSRLLSFADKSSLFSYRMYLDLLAQVGFFTCVCVLMWSVRKQISNPMVFVDPKTSKRWKVVPAFLNVIFIAGIVFFAYLALVALIFLLSMLFT